MERERERETDRQTDRETYLFLEGHGSVPAGHFPPTPSTSVGRCPISEGAARYGIIRCPDKNNDGKRLKMRLMSLWLGQKSACMTGKM